MEIRLALIGSPMWDLGKQLKGDQAMGMHVKLLDLRGTKEQKGAIAMPKHVRNFWVELSTDARSKPVASGPRSKDGGFHLKILMRENGEVSPKEIMIVGQCMSDGTLLVTADVSEPTILVSDNNQSAILQSTKR